MTADEYLQSNTKPGVQSARTCSTATRKPKGNCVTFSSPPWCKVVKTQEAHQDQVEKGREKSMKSEKTVFVRASISFLTDLYETFEDIAKQKKLSLASGCA